MLNGFLKHHRLRKEIFLGIVGLLVILVVARAILPLALKTYINKTLAGIENYDGQVEDVDVALWRGAYELHGVRIVKTGAKHDKPFFSADEVEVALDWSSLFRGHLVSKVHMHEPKLQFVQTASKASSQTSVDESWQRQLMKLYPFEINKFYIYNGFIRFENKTSDPKINFYAKNLDLTADNISNTTKSDKRLPSSVKLTGKLMDSAKLNAKADFDLITEPTEIDMNIAATSLDLREINDFAKAYGNFDFEKGKLNVTLELAASKTNYSGYVKTALIGADVLDWKKEKKQGDSTGHLIWEGLAGSIADIFENQKKNQFAARIPLKGSRKELKVGSWEAVGSILKNAFVKALSPELEDSVEFSDAIRSGSTKDADK